MSLSESFNFLKRDAKSISPAPLLIMLHGYGSNEKDLFQFADKLDERLIILSLRAPQQLGHNQYQWFALNYSDEVIDADLDQAQKSCELLSNFIDEAILKFNADPKKIFLLGFSQGAMIAFHTALIYPEKIFSVLALSGRLTSMSFDKRAADDKLKHLKIFISHGINDEIIPINRARNTKALLEKLPIEINYNEYKMGHGINLDCLKDFTNWIKEKIIS
ncbi:MAG: alpha/beta fold hydrolase [Bacteroidetes bacterium]|nr:alpha/beta fold hydrolase [Bacteroidota bacterium]